MAKQKVSGGYVETPAESPQPPAQLAFPTDADALPWHRIRLITDRNGVRGWILERLDLDGPGGPVLTRVHDVDMRDSTLGHLLRALELAA